MTRDALKMQRFLWKRESDGGSLCHLLKYNPMNAMITRSKILLLDEATGALQWVAGIKPAAGTSASATSYVGSEHPHSLQK